MSVSLPAIPESWWGRLSEFYNPTVVQQIRTRVNNSTNKVPALLTQSPLQPNWEGGLSGMKWPQVSSMTLSNESDSECALSFKLEKFFSSDPKTMLDHFSSLVSQLASAGGPRTDPEAWSRILSDDSYF